MPLEQSHKCFFLQQSSFPQVQQKCSGHTSHLNTENITKTGTPGSRLIKSMIAQLYQGHFSIKLAFLFQTVSTGFFFPLQIACCCSVTWSCPTLWDPMVCSIPGFPVCYQLLELAQTHMSQWCHPTISPSVVPFSCCLQSFPASGSFFKESVLHIRCQSIGVSASASVLPMIIQDRFPLGLTGLISLQSRGLSRVFSNITVQKHQFFDVQPSLWFNSHSYTTTGKTIGLTRRTFGEKYNQYNLVPKPY